MRRVNNSSKIPLNQQNFDTSSLRRLKRTRAKNGPANELSLTTSASGLWLFLGIVSFKWPFPIRVRCALSCLMKRKAFLPRQRSGPAQPVAGIILPEGSDKFDKFHSRCTDHRCANPRARVIAAAWAYSRISSPGGKARPSGPGLAPQPRANASAMMHKASSITKAARLLAVCRVVGSCTMA